MKSHRFFLGIAALSGFLAVCLGAFAAHGLKQRIDPSALTIWQTGVQYQMYHAFALLAVALLCQSNLSTSFPSTSWPSTSFSLKALKLAGLAFIIGSLLFSGSLYALALGGPRALGMITPIGGLGFLIGWLALAFYAWRH